MKSLKFLGIVGLAAAMTGCVPDWARENETGLIMEIAGIGDGPTLSDVVPDINDSVTVRVNVYRKNPAVTATSALEHVRLESYQVRYFRTDGHSVEGVDVPHRITGALNSQRLHTPTGTDEVEIETVITLVRQQAKHEPPLANLIRVLPSTPGNLLIPGQGLITTVAEITIYARQVTTGESLSATGTHQVTFGDFANAQ